MHPDNKESHFSGSLFFSQAPVAEFTPTPRLGKRKQGEQEKER
jgi:hypothetical protein